MQTDVLDHLKSLHTNAVDARHGYEEALEDAEGRGLSPLFSEMIALHGKHAAELAALLRGAGQETDDKGSFFSTIHRTIMGIRGLFGGLDESVLPGLIDGEKRNLSYYDEALALPGLPPEVQPVLTAERDAMRAVVTQMERQRK